MDKLIYESGLNKIIKDVTDADAEEFMSHCITLMRMLGYNEESIISAMENASVDDWI